MFSTHVQRLSWSTRFASGLAGLWARMISDVPVGAFLSTGLDSSSIVATMARVSNHPLRTYTITFPEKYRVGERTLDDPAVAERLARRMGCEHQTIVVDPDVTDLLPKITWHMDEPTADPAIIAGFLVCREARRNTTVLLSGVGGDELFGGYRKYCAHYWGEAYRKRSFFPAAQVYRAAVGTYAQLPGYPAEGVYATG